MKHEVAYPLNLNFIENRLEEAEKVFKKQKPHKGGFVGLEILEGIFPNGNEKELFDDLSFGEKLTIEKDQTSKTVTPLEVKREDGEIIGYLQFSTSVLLTALIKRGIKCFCFVEAKGEKGGLPSVAVSVYSEKY